MLKKFIFVLAFVANAIFVFGGCSSIIGENCPYLIADTRVELGTVEGKYNFAGTVFNFFNGSEKTVRSFSVSFNLYDSDGNNPFIGSNNVTSVCEANVAPNSKEEFTICLDEKLSVIPKEAYKVDFFYVSEIHYTDGTYWKDPFGMFSAQSLNMEASE